MSNMNSQPYNPQGSVWNRWEPHIHCPGTVFNDKYAGPDPMGDFLTAVENSSPTIRVLGITDYFSLDSYEKVFEEKQAGRLTNVNLLFANVEIRFGIETSKGSPINAHLLFSPDDPNHINEAKRFLSQLTFKFNRETYHCNRNDLIKLGKAYNNKIVNDDKAFEAGAHQFKVNFEQLIIELSQSDWAMKNILFAVSGNTTDGTAGLQDDDSFNALRNELERYAHVIFTSNPNQRDFWLGKGKLKVEEIERKWNARKLCLHGSDAHSHDKIGKPALNRFSWIKGDLTFEALKQACIEPEERGFIGEISPDQGISSKIIQNITIENAPWLKTNTLSLNSGLIAIIGARGSGKTALADFIAAGGYSLSTQLNPGSFLKRAENLIKNETVSLSWKNDEVTKNELSNVELEDLWDTPRIQYLSQQFVEELCSSEGLTDKLMSEIERVIYQAHDPQERIGTTTFGELLELKTTSSHDTRLRYEQLLSDISEELISEYEKRDSLPQLKKLKTEKLSMVTNDKVARQSLVSKGKENNQTEYESLSKALDSVRLKLENATKKHSALLKLQAETLNLKNNLLPAQLNKLKAAHPNTGITLDQWKNFEIVFKGDVETILATEITQANDTITKIKGSIPQEKKDLTNSYLQAGVNAELQTYQTLLAEQKRLQSLIGIDKENTRKFAALSEKITANESAALRLEEEIASAEKADERIAEIVSRRKSAYEQIFQAIIDEEHELEELYKPLMQSLKMEKGTLGKLSFYVERTIDLERWASEGEQLLDLRITGPFKGIGTLASAAKNLLYNAWKKGIASEVAQQMDTFRKEYNNALFAHAPVLKTNREEYRNWIQQLGKWLYSTEHIKLSYGIKYDHLDIHQLSPGTRGIVLLMLYLAIDKEDDRPLIIDQPEENLDPKSINDELVPIFKTAKHRRQIIIITHNANVVVNSDADQVIVADCQEHKANELPPISYQSGGIENPQIRGKICEILEGGEAAFRERAKRLRIVFPNNT